MIQGIPNAIWTQSPFLPVRHPKAISKRETIVKESKVSTELVGLGPESSMHSILIHWTEECGWGQRLKGPSTYPEGRPSRTVAKVNMPSTKGRRETHPRPLQSRLGPWPSPHSSHTDCGNNRERHSPCTQTSSSGAPLTTSVNVLECVQSGLHFLLRKWVRIRVKKKKQQRAWAYPFP